MKKIDDDYIIERVSDIEILQQMYNNHKCDYSENRCFERYYFRGQSNSEWEITPSIYRDINLNKNKHEQILESDNLFEEIAKLQHDGIHTRFIDFTTELYVALYFACNGNKDKDGKLFVCTYFNAPTESSKYTKIISKFTQITQDISVKDFCHKYDFDDEKSTLLAFLETGFMIEPKESYYNNIKESNPKMFKQRGCFYIPSNVSNYSEIKNKINFGDGGSCIIIKPEISLNWLLNNKIALIPKELKPQILEYLAGKDISKETLGLEDINEQ